VKSHFAKFIFIVLSLLAGAQALAQALTSELRLQQDSFVSPNFEATSKNNYQFMGLHLRSREPGKSIINIDLRGLFAFDAPQMNSLNVPDLYYMNEQEIDRTTLVIGRKREKWSELDDRWNLGVFEPVYKWNPLNPENQGLTGLFWFVEKESTSFTIYASPLYIPNQGPSFEINEQGEFVRSNPWFRRPPDSIKIFQEVSKLEYDFQKPNEASVVMQSSFASRLTIGEKEGFQAQASYAYKPMNQLALAYDGVLDISKDRGTVELLPLVVFHALTGLDMKYARKSWRIGISAIYDKPQTEVSADPRWTTPVFSDALLTTPFIDLDLGPIGVTLQRLQINGGEVKEKGPLSSPTRASISNNYPYREANQISLRTRLRFQQERVLRTQLAYIQSGFHKFDLLRWDAGLRLSRFWNLYSELQLVKAQTVEQGNFNEIADLANNDRWMIGVGYVF